MAIEAKEVQHNLDHQKNLDTITLQDAISKYQKELLDTKNNLLSGDPTKNIQDVERLKTTTEWRIQLENTKNRLSQIVYELQQKIQPFSKNKKNFNRFESIIVQLWTEIQWSTDAKSLLKVMEKFLKLNDDISNEIYSDGGGSVKLTDEWSKQFELRAESSQTTVSQLKRGLENVDEMARINIELPQSIQVLQQQVSQNKQAYDEAYLLYENKLSIVEKISKEIQSKTIEKIKLTNRKVQLETEIRSVVSTDLEKSDPNRQLSPNEIELQDVKAKIEWSANVAWRNKEPIVWLNKELEVAQETLRVANLELQSSKTDLDAKYANLAESRTIFIEQSSDFYATKRDQITQEAKKKIQALKEGNGTNETSLVGYSQTIKDINAQLEWPDGVQAQIYKMLIENTPAQSGKSLESLQVERETLIVNKMKAIQWWIDTYVEWMYNIKQLYYLEKRIAEEKQKPHQTQLNEIGNQLWTISSQIESVDWSIKANISQAQENQNSPEVVNLLLSERRTLNDKKKKLEETKAELLASEQELTDKVDELRWIINLSETGIAILNSDINYTLFDLNLKIIDKDRSYINDQIGKFEETKQILESNISQTQTEKRLLEEENKLLITQTDDQSMQKLEQNNNRIIEINSQWSTLTLEKVKREIEALNWYKWILLKLYGENLAKSELAYTEIHGNDGGLAKTYQEQEQGLKTAKTYHPEFSYPLDFKQQNLWEVEVTY